MLRGGELAFFKDAKSRALGVPCQGEEPLGLRDACCQVAAGYKKKKHVFTLRYGAGTAPYSMGTARHGYGVGTAWHGYGYGTARGSGCLTALCSDPRLSNGSEWLFHGKDEVRGALGARGWPGDIGVARGTRGDKGWPGELWGEGG